MKPFEIITWDDKVYHLSEDEGQKLQQFIASGKMKSASLPNGAGVLIFANIKSFERKVYWNSPGGPGYQLGGVK